MRHLFPRDVERKFPIAERGEGVWIWDTDGKRYLDADSGAISVISVGHGSADVVAAMSEQASRLAYVHNGQFENQPAEDLADLLAEIAPGDMNRSLFVSGGSEAVETAIKIARQYHVLNGDPDRHIVLSRDRSYHGATLLALELSGTPARQEVYRPYFQGHAKVPTPDAYRGDDGSALASADEVEATILRLGPEKVSAFIAEPIVAAAQPGLTPPPAYYERIREICDEHGVLFIADEVVTGFGRTGTAFGIEHWDAVPDMIATAKGLAGGYVPLAAVLMRDRIADTFESRSTSFVHGLTYEAHPVACAAGLAVLRIILRDGLIENARNRGDQLAQGLEAIRSSHAVIGDVRGKGLLMGLEFVADRETKKPLEPAGEFARRLHLAAQENGLMIYPGAPPFGGASDQVLISPPLIIKPEEVATILEILDETLREVVPA